MVIFDPSDDSLKEVNTSTAVQQIDIMPTVLEMLNYPNDYIAFGQDIMDTNTSHYAIGHMSGNYHCFSHEYLLQYNSKDITGVYNYTNDALFKNNLKSLNDSTESHMLNFTQAFIQEYNRRMIKDEMSISD